MAGLKALIQTWDNKPLAVFGLGLSGLSVVKAIIKAGGSCVVWDDNSVSVEKAAALGAKVQELDVNVLKKCAALLIAPGVPFTHPKPHPIVEAARAADTEILGDIELFYRANPEAKFIAVTGTNGKSTTVSLLQHVLEHAGVPSVLGGNVGTPIFDLKLPRKDGAIVLELSSFQLDLCHEFKAHIAVLLNITPDHLDRHGTIDNYATVKTKVFHGCDHAVIGMDDAYCRSIYDDLKVLDVHPMPVSVTNDPVKGVCVSDAGDMVLTQGDDVHTIGKISGIPTLHGLHNYQNAAVVYAVLKAYGLDDDVILSAYPNYPGLAHRQYPLRTINGVVYINDSKATNTEAAAKALASYSNIYWIVGGRAKDVGLDGLEPYLSHVKSTFLIGEAMNDFALWMERHGVPYILSRTMDIALAHAHAMAQDERGQPGGCTVLLSPACASFDQYGSFEDRGNAFAALVENLDDVAPLLSGGE